jgi:hypothetical protein
MYRVKFILSDGRKIYPTDKGQIQKVPQPLIAEKQANDFIEHGGYTQDLGVFWMGQPKLTPVRIIQIDFEHEASPLDRTAFILGGQLACLTFQT